jgi:hypothetical protein
MIRDRNINYKYKTEFIAAYNFNFYELDTTIKGTVGGTPALAEIGTLGVVGVKLDATGEFARLAFPVPSYWDTGNKLFTRVIWSDNTANTNSVTFAVKYQELAYGAAPIATLSGTGLDTLIVADAHSGTANTINATPWGTINADAIDSDYLVVDVSLTTDGSNLDPVVIGIEWAYLPKLTEGPQVSDQADPTDA